MDDFRPSSALVSVSVQLGDTTRKAVVMNSDLYGMLYKRENISLVRYKKIARASIDGKIPIAMSTDDIRSYGVHFSDAVAEENLKGTAVPQVIATYFGADSVLDGDIDDPRTAAVVSYLFQQGAITAVDDESGEVAIDNEAPKWKQKTR